ncbi:MAG: disulfide bond formation protein [Micrococcales bacterium]|nr:MAG: disulfide bond formation protein [Micrococcales bacterium]PIE28023.1 MAG: disulfide bond formation protein [Micrococcales bacterium]
MTGSAMNGPAQVRERSALVPVLVAVIAVLAVALGVLLLRGGGDTARTAAAPGVPATNREQGQPQGQPQELTEQQLAALRKVERNQQGDPLARGDLDAPVVIVVYSDYACPYCARHALGTETVLADRYLDDGVLRMEWHDFPAKGEGSVLAARAARAAGEQRRFWEYNNALFARLAADSHPEVSTDLLAEVAQEAGVDAAKLQQDMQSQHIKDSVQADYVQAQSIGVTATPTFLINGQPVVGAQPVEAFTAMIDKLHTNPGDVRSSAS